MDDDGNVVRGEGGFGKVGGRRPQYQGILAGALGPAGACGSSPTTATVNKLSAATDGYMLTVTGMPTGGSVTVNVGTQTLTVNHNDTAATVQANLRALPNIDPKTKVASGSGPLPQSPLAMRIVFAAGTAVSDRNVSMGANSLTGGSAPAATIVGGWGYTGEDVLITNRAQSIDAAAGTFLTYEKVGRENRAAWLDC